MQLHAEIHWPVNSKQTYDQQITYLLSNQWRTHMVRFYVVSQSKNKATKVSVSLSSAIFFCITVVTWDVTCVMVQQFHRPMMRQTATQPQCEIPKFPGHIKELSQVPHVTVTHIKHTAMKQYNNAMQCIKKIRGPKQQSSLATFVIDNSLTFPKPLVSSQTYLRQLSNSHNIFQTRGHPEHWDTDCSMP